MNRWYSICVAASFALLPGCHHIVAPTVTYSLPPAPLTPVGSPPVIDGSNDFLATFCSVYAEAVPGEKLDCYHYMRDADPRRPPGTPKAATDPELSHYRVVMIGGFLHTCLSDPSLALYHDAQAHMQSHRVTLERVPLTGVEPVEVDAERIVDYLKTSTKPDDKREILLLGYSKGAPDGEAAIVALRRQTAPAIKIAALITVAGMVGGTRLYDSITDPAGVSYLLSKIPILACPPGERNLHSLSRQERYRFLRDKAAVLNTVPSYAMATTSSLAETSLVFVPFWNQLSVYSTDQDGQMAVVEQIPPGAVYLGTARADHWAVAMPFEFDSRLTKIVNHNHYPRIALIEAMTRYVVADLADKRE
jgi:hypothetical protein